ncbi:MAG: TonB-dependent receptor [bacterium]
MRKMFLVFFLFVFYCIAWGQASNIKNIDADSTTLKYQLEDITITATRYPERIIEIPYSVTIIPVEELKNLRGYGFDEVMKNVPGVLAQSRSGNQDVRIVIRGFGARGAGDRSNSGTSRGIRIMLDGIPETEPDGRTSFDNIDFGFAQNIEVVRSNASALWGNASGGIINVSTEPIFTSPFISLGGSSGSFGFNKIMLNTGANFNSGKIYVSLSNSNYDGWREHSSSSRAMFNIGLISNLGDATRLGVHLLGASNMFHIPGPLTQAQFDEDAKQANSTYLKRDERRFNRLGRIGITFDHSFDGMNEISAMAFANPKYLQRSERNTFRDFTRYHVGGNVLYKNKMNFGETTRNIFSVGLDEAYQDGAILFYSLSETNGRGETLKDNKREGANTFGAFAQDEIMINEKVSVIVGARYDNITYYSESFIDPSLGLQQKSFEKVTPKAGITYMFSPSHSIYANLGGGVEVPAGNETDPAGTFGQDTVYNLNPLLEPITSTTYELGTKQVLYFGKEDVLSSLTYDLALYYIDIKNDIIPYRGGRFYFTAGKTNRMGIEFSSTFEFFRGISMQTAFTYSLNKYKEYMVDSVHYGEEGKFANYKDNKVAGIPDYFYNVSFGYTPEFFNTVKLSFSVGGVGKYFVDDANELEAPSYNLFGLTLSTTKAIKIVDNLSIEGYLNINNLTDEKYVASAFINPDLVYGEPVYLEPGLPQSVTLGLRINY